MNIEKYNILRITTCQVRNHWNEIIFEKDTVVQAIMDLGWCWLAKPVGANKTPRMLPKSECQELQNDRSKKA